MKKVTVITLQNIRNYGSALQAVATREVFRVAGCDVDFINYKRANVSSLRKRISAWTKNQNFLKRVIMGIILFPSFAKQELLFNRFIKRNLNQQKKEYTCIDDFKNFPIESDIYCTGSDQTWNSSWNNGILPELFLKFVPDNVKKISYAASIGKDLLDDFELTQTKSLLERYDAISVREVSAKIIVEQQLGLPSAEHVLDPTLQVDKNFWMSILSEKQRERKDKGRYVLVYQLNTNSKFDAYAKEFARRKGWKLIRFCNRYDQWFKCGKAALVPEVTDFVSLIANAGCVITDSFHASAFSCNMNTPMIAIYPNSFSSRLDSLLNLVKLENRHLTDYNDFSFVENTEIDFTEVNRILEDERKKGWNFIKGAIAD